MWQTRDEGLEAFRASGLYPPKTSVFNSSDSASSPKSLPRISFLANASRRQVSVPGKGECPDSQYERQPGGCGFKEAGLAFRLF